jgi:DNA-binding CsgD family transcriptional regulator
MPRHPANGVAPREANADGQLAIGDASSDLRLVARRSTLAFAAIGVLAGADILSDLGSGIATRHLLVEGALVAVALAAVWRLRRLLRRTGREVQALRGEVATWRAEAERWRRESHALLAGLGAAMDQQFDRWELSPAEREVALLLVKGLASNEIATVRGTSERTVRQQSQAVYRKAGLAGRAELAAFFLEDLLLPGSLQADTPSGTTTCAGPR